MVQERSSIWLVSKGCDAQLLFKKADARSVQRCVPGRALKLNGLLNVDRMSVPDKEKERFKKWLLKYSN